MKVIETTNKFKLFDLFIKHGESEDTLLEVKYNNRLRFEDAEIEEEFIALTNEYVQKIKEILIEE